jgi:hypothetical protein
MVLRMGRNVDVKRVAETNLDEIIQLIVRDKPGGNETEES